MKRRFRLTRSTDIERVRRVGRSYPHPLVVLVALPNQMDQVRVAIIAGRSVGKAVVRNRAKRVLRACLDGFMPALAPGWDLVVLARKPLSTTGYWETRQAMKSLLQRANVLTRSEIKNEPGLFE